MSEDWRAVARARRTRVKLGGLALLATGILGAGSCLKPIARDLTDRTHAALAAAGFPHLEVSFKGREGRVSGVVGTQAELDRVKYYAESQAGVRWIDLSGVSFDPPGAAEKPTAAVPTHVSIEVNDGKVRLAGVVPTAADRARAAQAAAQSFGADAVTDNIRVEPATAAEWLPTAWDALPALAKVHNPTMRVAGRRTTLIGAVPEADHEALLAAVRAAHPGQTIDDRLTVMRPATTELSLTVSGKRATLAGTVPSQDAKDEAGAAAAALFGAANVVNGLAVDPAADTPEWLAQLWGALDALGPVREPSIKTDRGTLTVGGKVETDRVKQRVGKAVTAACPDLKVDDQLQVVKAVTQAEQAFAELMREVQGKGVYFDSGSVDIKAAGAAHLDKVADLLHVVRKIEVRIAGHTDNQGSTPSNRTLSQKRANAVKRYLIGEGVEARRLRAKGYGERKPVASNKTPEGRAMNRRIEFIVRGKR